MKTLSTEQQDDIDAQIFIGYLPAVKRICEICGVGINEAKRLHWERYKKLRAEHNTEFTCSDEEYCAGILE